MSFLKSVARAAAAYYTGGASEVYFQSKDARDATRRREDSQGRLNEMALDQERASIINRVDAAKAAGIHPLVAMGAQGLGGPVVTAGTEFGQPIPDFYSPRARGSVDMRSPDQKRRDAAEADLAELQVEAARRRLATQPGNGGAPNQLTGTGSVVPSEATPYPVTHVKIEGQALPPAAYGTPHQTPGVAPGWDVVQIHSGRDPRTGSAKALKMVVPGGSVQRENWGEQLGELPFWLLPQIVQQSAAASGISSGEWIRRVLFGYGGAEAHVTPKKGGGSREVYGPVR